MSSTKTIVVNAPAKVNLYLDVVGVREDGYHLLEMVNQTVDLYDKLIIVKTGGSGITLSCNKPFVPLDNTNTAYKAAMAYMQATGLSFGVDIEIVKNIPHQAGLGGESTDAAATLLGLNRLCDNRLSKAEILAVAEGIGADVPFCFVGGTALVGGIGERITPIKRLSDCYIVIAKPEEGVATQTSFGLYDKLIEKPEADIETILAGIQKGNLSDIGSGMHNSLEAVVSTNTIFAIKSKYLEMGALGCGMTGSGSAVVGLFHNKLQAKKCYRSLFSLSSQIFLSKPISHGVFVDYL